MEKYISKSALVAEIKKYISNYRGILNNIDKSSDDWVDSTLILEPKIDVLQHILFFLDTIEVKEVDLEKELIIWHRLHFKKGGTFEKYGGFYLANSSQLDLAKHFFELGLKAQKGE